MNSLKPEHQDSLQETKPPLTNADLDAADALAREATAGEWTADDHARGEDSGIKVLLVRDGSLIAFVYEGDDNASVQRGHDPRMAANAAFIAAAREGWPAAVAEVRRLREREATLVRQLDTVFTWQMPDAMTVLLADRDRLRAVVARLVEAGEEMRPFGVSVYGDKWNAAVLAAKETR